MKAASYVYRRQDRTPSGYVGRHVQGTAYKIANPGDEVPDHVVEELGLDDLDDHTDYKAILAQAKKDGAPITVKDAETGQIRSVVQS